MTNQPAIDAPDAKAGWRALYPFQSHWLDLDGVRMHYVDERPAEEGRTVLFVHGNPTWSFHWRRLIAAVRGTHRAVSMDHLGCGLSDLAPRPLTLAEHTENVRRLVEGLDLRRVTLIAQDWGGAIGLGAMLREQSRLERIVLFNTGAFPPWYIPWRIRACRWPVIGRLAVQGGNAFSLAALRMTLNRKRRLEPDVAAGYLAPYDCWSRRAAVYQFVRDIPASAEHPTWQTLEKLEADLPRLAHIPTLLAWGERDWCFTTECLDKFVEHWPHAEVHRLADVGHWVVEDAPEEAERLVSEFLARGRTDH